MSVEVVKKIGNILKGSYNTKNYVELVREIFPNMRIISPDRFNKEYSNFSSHIEGYTHIGTFQGSDKKIIIIMSVQLKKAVYVENARSKQRSFAKKLIENGNADAAFIAFYTEGETKWRLSLVRLDYEMKIENGYLKTAEKITPARRYSYLVGQDEPCHTAISRMERFITDSIANPEHPTLDTLEEAFSVEKVTDEFFNLYCEKFHQLREQLEAIEDFRIEAEQHNFTSAQFAKKLMGQIVFLYFLQKKGWLGVKAWPNSLTEKEYINAFYAHGAKSRELIPVVYCPVGDGTYKASNSALNNISDEDEEILAMCVKGNHWGSGPRNFMRRLFNLSEKRKCNFYNDLLEPLFYDTLNRNRGENGYCPALHCRIPFLSGGLFEPIDGYDWKHNDFSIPNEIFSNVSEKGRDCDGILDIFDRYNFTMSEDEPMEREVAIDPEMLGKVFENLLEIQDRKSKGAFYTPREIVHYMCQESLINYLTNATNIDGSAIRDFILYGDFMKDQDTEKTVRVTDKLGRNRMEFDFNKDLYISEEILSFKKGVNRLLEIDNALKDVRVADPAVGSGAFPLGMLNEIVRARQNISAYLAITMNTYDARLMYQLDRSVHSLKYETIRNCIFAADIDPSAVDIAQLRLWLALVIDDEINPNAQTLMDGHKNPLPLPNLESNILCGNSLLDEFEGKKLVDESSLLNNLTTNSQIDVYHSNFESILAKLIEKQDELFCCENTEKKQQLKQDISSLRDMVIMSQLKDCASDIIQRYDKSKLMASKPYLLWQLDFARVFKEKGGFDIIIGNPPYIQLQKTINDATGEKLGDQYNKAGFESYIKTGDIYCLFYEKGYQLLHDKGVLTFITSNKWMRAGYGKKLRDFFAKKTNPCYLIDFAGQKIFASATVDVNILMFTKEQNKHKTVACIAKDAGLNNLSVFVWQNSAVMSFDTDNSWTIMSPIEQSIKRKIEHHGTELKDWNIKIYRGILTGFNEAFIITGEKKDELIAADPKSAELIRPILRGRDIQRYGYSFAGLWLINVHNGLKEKNIAPIDINNYPAIKKHLDNYYPKLAKRADKGITPYNLRNCAYMNDFFKQKIIWKRIGSKIRFSFDNSDMLCLDSTCFATGKGIPYLVAVLNTSMGNYLLKDSPKTGTGDLIISVQALEPVRVPLLNEEEQKPYELLLYSILDCIKNGKDYSIYEKQLEAQVFDAYGLTESEREFVTQTVNNLYR